MKPKIMLISLFFSILLSGCRAQEPRVVSFMVFGDPAELAAYQNLVDAFAAQHAEIDLQLQHIPGQSEYRRRLAAGLSSGAPPDVMLLNYRRFATFATQGGWNH